MELIEALSHGFPTHTIVVRPHPLESHDPWVARASTLPNVKVIYQGNVIEWILASEICIHNNCMTGIEAYLVGKTAVAYRPVCDERFELFLPNALTTQALSLDEVLGLVTSCLEGGTISKSEAISTRRDIARYFIANSTGKRASERIMDALATADVPVAPLSYSASRLSDLRMMMGRQLATFDWRRDRKTNQNFWRQKFPGMRTAHFTRLLGQIGQATGQYGDIKVRACNENVFCVYQES
jgi:hypothetical protein